jgi:hypothetical protein
MLQNPKTMVLRKFMVEVLGNKIVNYEDLLTRIGVNLVTESDLQAFTHMINDILGVGYLKAVTDYRTQLNDMGIEVTIKE